MISANDLSPAELAALLHFHADAGVEFLLEEDPVDRFAEFAARANTQPTAVAAGSAPPAGAADGTPAAARQRPATPPAERQPASNGVAMPDEHAVTNARFAAESAGTLVELKAAIEAFSGCNLKMSARSTIFASGDAASGIMVIGPMPNGDDDREGIAFAGRQGVLLDRMLNAIGLSRETVLLSTVIPWRPPGDRSPSVPEASICRPFIERQIELAQPRHVLLLGNFTARFFFGGNETIHALRGKWHEIGASSHSVPALASLHPHELLTAPASKGLAWRDLLAFKNRVTEG
ncbi:MAG: uracil-DNA glycosylase [Allorhizobium sp.]